MAITLQPLKLSINLTSVVDGAISSVKAVRKTEQARKEAEFQRAIANGLSYDEQVRLRKEQLEEETVSFCVLPDYTGDHAYAVGVSGQGTRFNKYRTRY